MIRTGTFNAWAPVGWGLVASVICRPGAAATATGSIGEATALPSGSDDNGTLPSGDSAQSVPTVSGPTVAQRCVRARTAWHLHRVIDTATRACSSQSSSVLRSARLGSWAWSAQPIPTERGATRGPQRSGSPPTSSPARPGNRSPPERCRGHRDRLALRLAQLQRRPWIRRGPRRLRDRTGRARPGMPLMSSLSQVAWRRPRRVVPHAGRAPLRQRRGVGSPA